MNNNLINNFVSRAPGGQSPGIQHFVPPDSNPVPALQSRISDRNVELKGALGSTWTIFYPLPKADLVIPPLEHAVRPVDPELVSGFPTLIKVPSPGDSTPQISLESLSFHSSFLASISLWRAIRGACQISGLHRPLFFLHIHS